MDGPPVRLSGWMTRPLIGIMWVIGVKGFMMLRCR